MFALAAPIRVLPCKQHRMAASLLLASLRPSHECSPTPQVNVHPLCQVAGETVSLMVPCCDMANHVLSPNAGYRYVPEADAFQLQALQVRGLLGYRALRHLHHPREMLYGLSTCLVAVCCKCSSRA